MIKRNGLVAALIVCGIALIPFVAHAQSPSAGLQGLQSNLNRIWSADYLQEKFSGLDLSRFSMQQSYEMMFVSGGNVSGRTYSMYTNVLSYKLSDPLELKFKLGYMMEPFAQDRMRGGFSNGQFLPGLMIQYRPFKNVYLNLSVERYPGYYSPYSSYWMHDGIGRMFGSNP